MMIEICMDNNLNPLPAMLRGEVSVERYAIGHWFRQVSVCHHGMLRVPATWSSSSAGNPIHELGIFKNRSTEGIQSASLVLI